MSAAGTRPQPKGPGDFPRVVCDGCGSLNLPKDAKAYALSGEIAAWIAGFAPRPAQRNLCGHCGTIAIGIGAAPVPEQPEQAE